MVENLRQGKGQLYSFRCFQRGMVVRRQISDANHRADAVEEEHVVSQPFVNGVAIDAVFRGEDGDRDPFGGRISRAASTGSR